VTETIRLERVAALVPALELPCFVYDASVLAANIANLLAAFPRYHYPVKSNPHPDLLRIAVSAGAQLDLCSDGDLDLADTLGLSAHASFTGVGLTRERMARVAASRCRVNLDSLDEVGRWSSLGAGRPCGLRLQVGEGANGYGAKFGLTPDEVQQAFSILSKGGASIAGIHVHDGHRGRTPEEAARVLASALDCVDGPVARQLDYLSLGGGWPHAYEGERAWSAAEFARAADNIALAGLCRRGFAGEVTVEPGEFIVGPAGVWLARVATVKQRRGEPPTDVVILDTPTPVPCADFRYPMHVLRATTVISDGATVNCAVYGGTNSSRDLIRANVLLPQLSEGDVIIIADAGAYVHSLISGFNERVPPREYVLPA
jgi:diaminopimelate decarboxylase